MSIKNEIIEKLRNTARKLLKYFEPFYRENADDLVFLLNYYTTYEQKHGTWYVRITNRVTKRSTYIPVKDEKEAIMIAKELQAIRRFLTEFHKMMYVLGDRYGSENNTET